MVKLNENAVREAAYYNWQNAGCPQGQDEYFWNMALAQLNNCSRNSSCKASSTTKKSSSTAKKSLSTKASSTKTTSKKSK